VSIVPELMKIMVKDSRSRGAEDSSEKISS